MTAKVIVDRREFSLSPYRERQARLGNMADAAGLDAIVLNPGASLSYLTGLGFHLMERPVIAIFKPELPFVMVIPELEQAKTESLQYPVEVITYGERPSDWKKAFDQAVSQAEITHATIGVEPTRMRYLELEYLRASAPSARIITGEKVLAGLRVCKDEHEIMAIGKAVSIAEIALTNCLPVIRLGMTERQLAAELTLQLLRAGSDPEFPFLPIVSSGPNSANPHAQPSDRELTIGDLLVIDWGASYHGYISDLTRTFSIGPVVEEYQKIASIVEKANEAGRKCAAPRVSAGIVDHAARQVIDQAGYGACFIHRTGHGIGLEGHEPPYIRGDNQQLLEPGMTFTVEPGIYLPGRGGVRIEDNLAITNDGVTTLSDLPRMLQRLID